jgi:nucleoside-diphosphate-sugar epimerase
MRVFVAGGTGALGQYLLPQLLAAGHQVTAMTRSAGKVEAVRAAGVEPVVADALDRDSVVAAVRRAEPEVVIHQLTSLAQLKNFRQFDKEFALTNRLRTEAIDNLLAGAEQAGARRFIAQSFGNWNYERTGGRIKTEEDRLDPNPPANQRKSLAAIAYLEKQVAAANLEGLALRYGDFYGPGSSMTATGDIAQLVRKRRFPIVGDGAGVWSFIHLEDAAAATVLALEHEGPAIYNIVDDEPATTAVWLTELAKILGAKPPQRYPRLPARIFAGEAQVVMSTESRGASNAKAKRELGWTLRYPSWRQGFAASYVQPATLKVAA